MPDIRQSMSTASSDRARPADLLQILERRVGTELRGATWISPRLLFLVFHTRTFRSHEPELTVLMDEAASPPLTRSRPFEREGARGQAMLVILPELATARETLRVQVRSWRRTVALDSGLLDMRSFDLRTLLRNELADLPPEDRAALLDMLASSSEWHSASGGGRALSGSLAGVRDALREPYPVAVTRRDQSRTLSVDSLLAIDERSYWIRGWMRDADLRPDRLIAVSPEGMRLDVLPGAYQHDRPDVRAMFGDDSVRWQDQAGFLSYFQLPAPSHTDDGWLCELHSGIGPARAAVEAPAPSVVRDPLQVRNLILSVLARGVEDADFLARNHMLPALTRLRERELDQADIECVHELGPAPSAPVASIVIPIHRNLGLMEHQIAAFAQDPELREAELILVLDSPDRREEFEQQARDLHALFGLSLRLAVLETHLGGAVAWTLGAGIARGPALALLHSDVIPRRPGWLGRMLAEWSGHPDVGAVGPRLLHEDDTIQSAGLFFRRPEDGDHLESIGFFEGFHRAYPDAQVSREVAALSGACLLVGRDAFQDVGGLCADFVVGGFEDTDLCLRLSEAGLENRYVGSAELYHLGGQSIPRRLRALSDPYNRWLHERLWGERIDELQIRLPVRGVGPAPLGSAHAGNARLPDGRIR